MDFLRKIFASPEKESPEKVCEMCGRTMQQVASGAGKVMLTMEEQKSGIGVAEVCWECGRLYCDNCYPSRPPNTCVCEQGRDKTRIVDGVTYRGSLHLVKVRYLTFAPDRAIVLGVSWIAPSCQSSLQVA